MTLIRRLFSSTSAKQSESLLGTLRVVGRDAHGIVAACSQVLGQHGCNIVKSEQWTDVRHKMFFQRLEFHHPSSKQGVDRMACEEELSERLCQQHDDEAGGKDLESSMDSSKQKVYHNNKLQQPFPLQCHWNWRERRQRVGIMVSKYDHCLWELLLRHSANELPMDIDVVISNHDTLRTVAETFDIPYHVIPITAETKAEQESKQLELLKDVDVVVLARYMQVLSPQFLSYFPNRILNIHHSFLPAFSGGSPYHKAYDRGVKLIGATAHYVTEVLDDGPIIEQDVTVVSHRDSVRQLMKKGRILERNVLTRALEAHLDDRVIVHQNKCVIFAE